MSGNPRRAGRNGRPILSIREQLERVTWAAELKAGGYPENTGERDERTAAPHDDSGNWRETSQTRSA